MTPNAATTNNQILSALKKSLLVLLPFAFALSLEAQTSDSLIGELKTINSAIAHAPSDSGKGRLISNRAMNIIISASQKERMSPFPLLFP